MAHHFKPASLYVLSGARCDLGFSLSIVSIVILTFLLSFLLSSQLGHIVQLALRDPPLRYPSLLLTHRICSPRSPLPSFRHSFFLFFLPLLRRVSLDILFSSLSGILSIFGFSLATFLPFYLSPPLPRPFSPFSFPSSFAFPFSGVQLVAYCSARSFCPSPLVSSSYFTFPTSHLSLFFYLICSQPRHIVWLAASLILQLLLSSATPLFSLTFFSVSMPSYPTDPEKWLKLPHSYQAVHARQVRWYPGDSYHTLPSSLIDKSDVSLANVDGDTLDGFMAALPHWDLPVVAGDPSTLPWRLIWTWHPVLEAFGQNKNANSSYTPDPWFYPSDLHDNQKEVYKLLPVEIENFLDHVCVYPLYRLIVFHHTSKPRHKMINLLTSKLALPGDSAYFLSLKSRQPGAPLPTIHNWVNDTCARKLHEALLVLLRQRSANDTASWKSYAKTNNIAIPDRPITLEELNQTSTPPTAADFPALAATVVPKSPAKAAVAAKKGSLTTPTVALRPSVPLRPPQTLPSASSSTSPPLPSQSPITPAVSPSLPSTMTEDSQLPTAPFPIAATTTPPALQVVEVPADIDMPPPAFSMPMSSLSGADKEKAVRPLLHNATTISVQPAPLPVPISRPLVHELYAQAFALLPTIHTFYGLQASAKAFGNFICIWYFKSLVLVFWKITFFEILGPDFIVLIW